MTESPSINPVTATLATLGSAATLFSLCALGLPFHAAALLSGGGFLASAIPDRKLKMLAGATAICLSGPAIIHNQDEIFDRIEDDPTKVLFLAGGILATMTTARVDDWIEYGEDEYHEVRKARNRITIAQTKERFEVDKSVLEARSTAAIDAARIRVAQELSDWIDNSVPENMRDFHREGVGLPSVKYKNPWATRPPMPPIVQLEEMQAIEPTIDVNEIDLDFAEVTPEQTATAALPVHDLWQELESSNRHIWLVATTQSGKTWSEYAILTHGFDRSNGEAQAIIADIKGSAFKADCGIPDYYFSDDIEDMPKHVGQIYKAIRMLSDRRRQRVANGGTWDKSPAPIFVVIPELNSFVQNLNQWDAKHPKPGKGQEDYDRDALCKASGFELGGLTLAYQCGVWILEIITQGLEDRVRLIVDAQTSRLEEFDFGSKAKFTGGTRNNLSMAAISRGGDYVGVRDFFSFNCRGMPGDPESAIARYDAEQRDKSIPIAATNMGGEIRLYQTPAIDKTKIKRPWKPIGKIKGDKAPARPATDPQPTGDGSMPWGEAVEQMKGWIDRLDHTPTDDELRSEICRLTGFDPSEINHSSISWLRRDLKL